MSSHAHRRRKIVMVGGDIVVFVSESFATTPTRGINHALFALMTVPGIRTDFVATCSLKFNMIFHSQAYYSMYRHCSGCCGTGPLPCWLGGGGGARAPGAPLVPTPMMHSYSSTVKIVVVVNGCL